MTQIERDHAIIDLWVGGESYAAIGRKFGVGRERVRQIVAKDPEAQDRRAERERQEEKRREKMLAELRAEAFTDRLRTVIEEDIRCVACGGWVIRDIANSKTCSPECAEAWSILRSFPEVSGDDHRLYMAKSIIRHPENYSDTEIEWAQRMKVDAPPPNRRARVLKEYRPDIYQELVSD